MSSQLDELYQSVILDHNKSPRNFKELPDATAHADGRNPLCGDAYTVWLRLEGDRIADAAFQGNGCAISKASASLMTTAVKGKTVAEAEALFDQFHEMLTGGAADLTGMPNGVKALTGVKAFPMRVKCATLSWHAMKEALKG
ncbi:MAG: SUF system NifU family Fe-S cluster assembly protein, partial [Gemmatimonadales bacterium]|nr:SUF system NifU family Fe-S cluster assembly protein [Gemmatimonadales bacterium]